MAQLTSLLLVLLLFVSFDGSESRHQNTLFSTAEGGNLCNSDKCELKSNWSKQGEKRNDMEGTHYRQCD